MNKSTYKHCDELSLFLDASQVAQVLGISTSSSYALLHSKGFPTLRVGGRMLVPKDQFLAWVEQHTGGGSAA